MDLKTWMDNLLIYDADDFMINRGAKAFPEDAPAFNAAEGVSDFAGALNAIRKYCHLRCLIFETHGAPGYVHFPKGGIDAGNAHRFASVRSSLDTDARILFEGCSVGQGDAGTKFLLEIGSKLLLGKGGIVGATTCSNFGSPLELLSLIDSVRMPPWGNLRIMQFDKNGSLIKEVDKQGALVSLP
jgi:hypothetical protein